MKDIRVEKFTKKLDCGATVEGFREIVYENAYEDNLREQIFDDFKEEN